MAGRRDCDAVVTAGRMFKANEFMSAADLVGEELPKQAASGSERHLNRLLNLKNKAAYTHQDLSPAGLRRMTRAAEHLVELARRAVASGR
ncbi:MAG: hypothetical protein PGN37_05945 [Mycobacterium kyogaense]|uniref:hypothetical protein n=1 Tax=Mycobacterium kyogaense TaxID=2212479 RepID=UPI002FF67DB1